MSGRVLVAYASRCGSTAEVAEAIAQELTVQGHPVDVRPAAEAPDPSGYAAVLVGSAINGGKCLPAAVQFVEKNRAALNRVPTAYFVVHAWALDDSPKSQAHRHSYLDQLRALATPKAEACFAGKIDPSRLPLGMKVLVKVIRAPERDYRNWDVIRGWARGVMEEVRA